MILKIRLCRGIDERNLEYSSYYYFESKSDTVRETLSEFLNFKNNFLNLDEYPEICDYEEIVIYGKNNY